MAELESNTMSTIARALQGFGAGVAGQGGQFVQQLDARRKMALLQDAQQVQGALEAGDVGRARELLINRANAVHQLGGDPSDTLGTLAKIDEGNVAGALNDAQTVTEFGFQQGFLTRPRDEQGVASKTFAELTETADLTPEEKRLAAKIELGLAPRAVGSASQTIAQTGQTQTVADSEAVIEGAKSGSKTKAELEQKLKLQPQVAEAVALATEQSKLQVKQQGEQRSNDRALGVYDAAIGSLTNAMQEPYTGPVAGLMPALTANQQIADGAVAMMAPVLKQIFRGAGEGTFTDKDQEMLLDMIPTRKDTPDSRAFKLNAIDSIVRAKLGPLDGAPQATSDVRQDEFAGFRIVQ